MIGSGPLSPPKVKANITIVSKALKPYPRLGLHYKVNKR